MLFTLPDELLLIVACSLPQLDLCRPSLVSKYIGSIAREALYRSPEILYQEPEIPPRSHDPPRVALLATTLTCRPELAQKVSVLRLEPRSTAVPVKLSMFGGVCSSVAGNMENFTLTMKETEIVGYVLRLIHNLQHLHLAIVNVQGHDLRDSMAYVGSSIQHVFGNGKPELEDLSKLSGLIKLQSLSLSCRRLQRAWFNLRHLKKFSVSRHCDLFDNEEAVGGGYQIKELEMERATHVLTTEWDHSSPRSISHFLSHFPLLEKLVLILCNTDNFSPNYATFPTILCSWAWGNFDTLLANVHPVAPIIQHLIVLECDHDHDCDPVSSFLNYVTPFTTLVYFQNLCILELHHEALICVNGTSRAPVEALLPASLEQLKIYTPQLTILGLLEGFPPLRPHFANLTTIELWPRNHHGDGYEAFYYRYHGVWYQLGAVGIEVAIFWHANDYNRD
jgi:hypothetical protein